MHSAITALYTAVIVIFFHHGFAAPIDWDGSFVDPIYGGQLVVCVTAAASGTFYGQVSHLNYQL